LTWQLVKEGNSLKLRKIEGVLVLAIMLTVILVVILVVMEFEQMKNFLCEFFETTIEPIKFGNIPLSRSHYISFL
jgi:high-affinity Fe2+/Pb2+ permease